MALALVTAPATEPVTRTEAKVHLRIESAVTADDTLIDRLIIVARQLGEAHTGRAFITQTWDLKLDAFPAGRIRLPKAPLSSISSVTYLDTNGASQTWDSGDYLVDAPAGP